MNSDVAGGKNSCNHFKKGRIGQTLKGTWRLEILWSCKKQTPLEMIGRCTESLKIESINQTDRNNIVDRPVSKVVLLLESEEVDEKVLESAPKKPWIKCNVISRYYVSWRRAMN